MKGEKDHMWIGIMVLLGLVRKGGAVLLRSPSAHPFHPFIPKPYYCLFPSNRLPLPPLLPSPDDGCGRLFPPPPSLRLACDAHCGPARRVNTHHLTTTASTQYHFPTTRYHNQTYSKLCSARCQCLV